MTRRSRVALALLLAACGERSAPLPEEPPLPLLARPTLQGDTFDPASVRGHVVVLQVWSPG